MLGCAILISLLTLSWQRETYLEHSRFRQISENEVLTTFNFTIVKEKDSDTDSHEFLLYPRLLTELAQKYNVENLILTVTQGRWADSWGYQPVYGTPIGAQLGIVLRDSNATQADKKVTSVVEALNGILCTSLSSMPLNYIASPNLDLLPFEFQKTKKTFKRYGIVSGDSMCTENLNRLLKLLPCRSSGLSTLLQSSRQFDSLFHSSNLFVKNVGNEKSIFTLLVNTVLSSPSNGWHLPKLLEREMKTLCPVAETTVAELVVDTNIYDVAPGGVAKQSEIVYNLEEILDIWVRRKPNSSIPKREALKNVKVWSTLGGFDQYKGTLTISLKGADTSHLVTVSQIIPYYLTPTYHKVHLWCFSAGRKPIQFTLPENAQCEYIIPVEKALLRLADYPPDANHGMYLPPAMVHLQVPEERPRVLASNTLLVALPVPDFSMPFNVICFVATSIMLIYGPVMSFTTAWLAPARKNGKWKKNVRLLTAVLILVLGLYLHYHEISPNEIRRYVSETFSSLNDQR